MTEKVAESSRPVALGRRPAIRRAVVLAALALLAYVAFSAPLPFVRAFWEARDWFPEAMQVPHRLGDRLAEGRMLQGKSRAEVIELLGEPDIRQDEGGMMIYVLGDERSWFGIDYEVLDIRFDASGKVVEAGVRNG